MNSKFRKYFLCSLMFLVMSFFDFSLYPLSAEQKPIVTDVRVGAHPDKTRFVMMISKEVSYRIFTLDDPYRVVIDFPNLEWKAKENIEEKGIVQGYRYGLYNEKVMRFVLDVKEPVIVEKAFFLEPESAGDSHKRFVIDLKSISLSEYKTQTTHVMSHDAQGPSIDNLTAQVQPTKVEPEPALMTEQDHQKRKKKVVVIDAGHGGVDPGAIGIGRVFEKTVTLAVAKELKKQILKSGQYEVYLTRESDIFLPLRQRVSIARKHQADLFISLHADSMSKRTTRGASFYTLSEKASDREAELLAARENKADIIAGMDLSVESEEVAGILIDLAQRESMNKSKKFSNVLEKQISKEIILLEKPNRSAGFAVLKAPDIPSVLIEMGYLSNEKDCKLLTTASHQQKLAISIHQSVDAFFKQEYGHGASQHAYSQ